MKKYKCVICHKMINQSHASKSKSICGKCTRLMRRKTNK